LEIADISDLITFIPTMKLFHRLRSLAFLSCLSTLIPNAFADDVRNGLVSYWPFDTVNGNTTPDLAFGNDLVLVNSPTSGAGFRGQAFSFNGSSQYIGMVHTNDATFTNNMGLPIYSAKRYTVMFWVKGAAAQNNKVVFAEGTTNTQNGLFLIGTRNGTTATPAGGVNASIRTAGGTTILNNTLSTGVAFDTANWHQVTWVDDAGTAKLYIDGTLDSVSYNYAQSPIAFNAISIGALVRSNVANYFAGSVDEVALWERTLSKSEIDEVRNNGIATPIPVFAPTLTTQPASVTNHVGDWTVFSVAAIGKRPFSYQWLKNSTPIPNATNQTYRASGLGTGNSGDVYSVEVTNPGGTTSSSNAIVTVLPDPTPDLASGLLSYWPFDIVTNAGGSTTYSTPDLYSKNDMVLTAMDANNLVDGQFGRKALSFDSALSQYATRVGGLPVYNNANYSVSLWVKGEGVTQDARRVFSESSTTANAPLFTLGTDTSASAQCANVFIRNDANSALVNGRKSTNIVFNNEWHHIVWVDANGKGKLYVDGVLDDADYSYTRSATTLTTTTVGAILRATPGSFYTGFVDEVATWNRVLSLAEIQKLETDGVPQPVSATAPSFSQSPTGTNILSRADLTLSAQVLGTSPLTYQWTKDGANVAGATTNNLVFTNIQVVSSGSYALVVTNVAGAVTSAPAVVTVTQRAAPPGILAIDFDNHSPAAGETQTGFQSFSLPGLSAIASGTPTTSLFGGVEVTLTGSGSSVDSRKRSDPVNSQDFTGEKILQDFIYATATTGTVGLDLSLKYLAPNQLYAVTVWSFDSGSPANRISDWNANGTQVIDNYTFNGSNLPTNDSQYQFSFNVAADANGKVLLQGRRDSTTGANAAVFLNALKIEVPPVHINSGQFVNNTVSLSFFTPNPEITHLVQETSALGGSWNNVTGVTFTSTGANTIQADFTRPSGSVRFYRIARPAP
jgi:hypothetical protein